MESNLTEKKSPVIYIADDEDNNLFIMKATLKAEAYRVHAFKDGMSLLDFLNQGTEPPDLMLLDVMMPGLSGFDVLREVRSIPRYARVPIVMVTGLDDIQHKVTGLDTGADDYVGKPFHPLEVRARVRSLLRIKLLGDQIEKSNLLLSDEKLHLESLVRERTLELENTTLGVVAALEKANELNDTDTGMHLLRVCSYSELIAREIGLPGQAVVRIRRFASLHDVGKVGLPDEVLKKPGPLTQAEFDVMKRHTVMGYEMLTLARSDPMARNIALCHHEKFNGRGYPYGLAGTDIPLEARIVALADVFDALTTRRCYKNAYPLEMARRTIEEERGKHFDPALVDIHLGRWDDIREILKRYQDTGTQAAQFDAGALPTKPRSALWEYDTVGKES
ncbi:MAG: response regulator [Deltaproteobacteria bacterium]|nr:response regulator [Deltaproteobacteria bacterium]